MDLTQNLIIKLEQNKIKKFIEELAAQKKSAKKLKYGYEVRIPEHQLNTAKLLNEIYENLVWGQIQDASNQNLRTDEKVILTRWLKIPQFSNNVMEVGCGSGRVTLLLAQFAKTLYGVEREKANLKACHFKLKKSPTHFKSICKNFTDIKSNALKVDSIFLIENLMGMNLPKKDRAAILKNAYRIVRPGGIMVLGFRCRADVSRNKISYQAMPYSFIWRKKKVQLFGLAINWNRETMIQEVKKSCGPFKIIDDFKGAARPAGGYMHFLVLQKTSGK